MLFTTIFYAHNPTFFHSITLPFQPYNFPNTLQIPHSIPIKCYNSQGFMLDSRTPHVLFWDILSFLLGFNYHQFTAGYQLLICNYLSVTLSKASLKSSRAQHPRHVHTVIPKPLEIHYIHSFLSLGFSNFLKTLLSNEPPGINVGINLNFSSSFLLQSIIIYCKIFFTYFSSN